MKDRFIILLYFLIIGSSTFGQANENSTTMKINFFFGEKPIQLGEDYVSKNNDTLSIETLKLYLSSFEILYKDDSKYIENKSYHLIDIEKPESLLFSLKNNPNKEVKSIKFNIGIDSLASVSGAMDGDLDATNGMYWAWQSGFINMKIEGKSSSCKTRKNQFHFHVGGYLKPYYAMREIHLNFYKKDEINLVIDLSKLFDDVHLKETNSIMIPGKEAMIIADKSVKMFSIK